MALATRFCPGCGCEVEDAGGFCLLGHRLTLAPSGLDDLQADISTAFEVARGQMENTLRLTAATTPLPSGDLPMGYHGESHPAVEANPAPVVESPAPVTETPAPVTETPATQAAPGVPPPPPPGAVAAPPGPPPPPGVTPQAPPGSESYWQKVWGEAAPADLPGDPITAFAPAPSMNWGPEGKPERKTIIGRLRRGA